MGFSAAIWTRWLLLTLMAVATVCSAEIQEKARQPGQPIIFSAPVNDTVSSNMPSLAVKPPPPGNLADTVKSPIFHLDAVLPAEPLPEPQQPRVSPEEAKRMKRQQEERDNWSLLTPEQILGLPTQEKVLGVQDRDRSGDGKEESVVVQYYERQQRLRARTNNYDYSYDYGYDYGPTNGLPKGNVYGSRESSMGSDRWPRAGARQDSPTLLSQLLARTQSSRTDADSAQNDGWSRPFNLPAAPPGQTPEQKVAMEQFQQLLKPRAAPGDSTKASGPGNSIFPAASTASGLTPQIAPAVTTIGGSYPPLNNGLNMPVGLVPLSGISGPNNPSLPTLAPAWTPAPPPWQSTGPQLGVMPSRKF
jgi:hypothetical protein